MKTLVLANSRRKVRIVAIKRFLLTEGVMIVMSRKSGYYEFYCSEWDSISFE